MHMYERKRYQVFVSSTFDDLVEERAKVMEAILNFECFPVGMEMFPAMDEEIFDYIKKIIEDSDYFLLIIGGRYGSVDENGVSWTEKEYDYAVNQKHLHVMVFDHEDFTTLPKVKIDTKNRKKLLDFKKKVHERGKLIKHWKDANHLANGVTTSLKSALDYHPGIGWVRADSRLLMNERDNLLREIVERENSIKSLESVYIQKCEDNRAQESLNDGIQYEIKNLREQIKNLKEQLISLKEQSMNLKGQVKNLKEQEKTLEIQLNGPKTLTIERKSQVQTEIFTIPKTNVTFKMIHVEGGMFMMGANKGDEWAYPDEKPVHQVTLSDYWIGETQVTQAMWQEVMDETPSRFKGSPNLPVESVSWVECQEFIKRLNELDLTEKKFDLPTEAQWEFAARGGNLGKEKSYLNLYAGSNYVEDIAWFEGNSLDKTHPGGVLEPNELGIYDMSGNVWEWCKDWYDNNYSNSPMTDPMGSEVGSHNVVRGGSWCDNAAGCRVSCRLINRPEFKDGKLGLRLALIEKKN